MDRIHHTQVHIQLKSKVLTGDRSLGTISPPPHIDHPLLHVIFFFGTVLLSYFNKFIHLKFVHLKFTHLKFNRDPKFISQKFIYPIQIWIWIQILVYRPKVYKSKVYIPISNLNLNSNIFIYSIFYT